MGILPPSEFLALAGVLPFEVLPLEWDDFEQPQDEPERDFSKKSQILKPFQLYLTVPLALCKMVIAC